MGFNTFKIICFLLINISYCTSKIVAQTTKDKGHIEISMRMIGHQLLLKANDSASRVMPIKKDGNKYQIEFEADFQFSSGELVSTVGHIMQQSKVAESYRVEVIECDSNQVIYSYEIGDSANSNMIPCGMRLQPKACYYIIITLLDINFLNQATPKKAQFKNSISAFIFFLLSLISILLFLKRRKKLTSKVSSNLIYLGKYQFDKRNSELLINDQKIELSGKESDLLLLLHDSINKTVKRELILRKVWEDDGDYIGRTLDVFISKLRKKLQDDPTVRIVNIRGIGYKMILNDS